MTFITFQGLTADKDGNKTQMGRISLVSSQVTGVLECVDKHECIISNCCSIIMLGGGQITVEGNLDSIIEKLEEKSYGQQL